MIFLTVGAQMPFDRLVRVVDRWAGSTGRDDIFAQIGRTSYRPQHLSWSPQLDPIEFRAKCFEAELIIAHAGMGTIITAMELSKPILVLPRQAHLRETRNDHQRQCLEHLSRLYNVHVARDEAALETKLAQLNVLQAIERVDAFASIDLLRAVRGFIHPEEVEMRQRRAEVELKPEGQRRAERASAGRIDGERAGSRRRRAA